MDRTLKPYILYLSLLLLTLFGTALTDFSLGIWLLQREGGSLTSYSWVWFLQAAPATLLAPYLGVWIDRWNKRRVLIYGQLVAGSGSLLLLTLHASEQLSEGAVLAVVACSGLANAVVYRAFYVSLPALIGRQRLVQAHGWLGASYALVQMGVPALAPVLYTWLGLTVIFWIDLATFTLSALAFALLGFVDVPRSTEGLTALEGLKAALAWIRQDKGQVALLAYFSLFSFCIGLVHVLFTPLVLSISDPYTLGQVLFIVGIGSLSGGGIMGLKKSLRRPLQLMVRCSLAAGLVLTVAAATTLQPYLLAVAGLWVLTAFTMAAVAQGVVVQTVVPATMLGRVSGCWALVAQGAFPVAFLVAGPLIDGLAHQAPALLESLGTIAGEANAASATTLAIQVVMGACGVMLTVASLYGYRWPALRILEATYRQALQLPATTAPSAASEPAAEDGMKPATRKPYVSPQQLSE